MKFHRRLYSWLFNKKNDLIENKNRHPSMSCSTKNLIFCNPSSLNLWYWLVKATFEIVSNAILDANIIWNFNWHNIIQTHSSVMWDWLYYVEYCSHSSWMWEIFVISTIICGIFLTFGLDLKNILHIVPQDTAMDLNNVMDIVLLQFWIW